MRFGVLGPLAVWTDGGRPVHVPEPKVRTLLADLLVSPGRPVPSGRLVDDLWGARPPRNPAGTLQARVSQLRATLDAAEPGARALIAHRPPGYVLDAAGSVDAERFATLTLQAAKAPEPRLKADLLADALALWRGPAFADFADHDFARAAIAGLEERRLTAVEDLAETRLRLGEHHRVAADLADPVIRHPLRERLRAAYMRALHLSGRRDEALATYHDLRELLATDLGLDPSPELAALHQQIIVDSPSLRPAPTLAAGNLPEPVAGLIGREDAIIQTRDLLRSGRLVTLTGPGGVGKTRLALATASAVVPDFPDGAWLVELAPARPATTAALADTVAGVLGLRDDSLPGDPVGRLATALRPRRALLVLDNCEHVIGPAAELAARLLASAPGLRVLATGREPLGIEGERLQVVPPLDQAGAVELFVARATAAAPGFALDAATAGPVDTICRRLDGIPLALELAATRVRALDVRELAARLDDRFRLLTSGRRDAPARQRTLRAVIDWSWDLLDERERQVLRRLAVHLGGCTLEAAEHTCSDPEHGVPAADVLDLLAALVDRSLLTTSSHAGEPTRYRLLESVAAYCLERLDETGEQDQTRHRHARYYTDLAEQGATALRGPEQGSRLERLDHETPNLRAALDWAVASDSTALALRLVNALGWYWYLRGRYGEAARSFSAALSLPSPPRVRQAEAEAWRAGMVMASGDGSDTERLRLDALRAYEGLDAPTSQAWAQWFLSYVHWPYGDLNANVERVAQALETFRKHRDRWGTAAALSTRAKQAMGRGDLDGLAQDGESALALFRDLGDAWGRLEALDALGRHTEIVGDYPRSAARRQEALTAAQGLGLGAQVATLTVELGRLALLSGDLDKARELHERALRLAVEVPSRSAQEFAEIGLGMVARRQGDLDAADAWLLSSLDWLREIGGHSGIAFALAQRGFVAEQRGDAVHALALHRESLDAARATGDPRAIALSLEGLAGAHALACEHAEAARLLGAASALRASTGAPLPPAESADVDRITSATRDALGKDRFTTEFDQGVRDSGGDHELT